VGFKSPKVFPKSKNGQKKCPILEKGKISRKIPSKTSLCDWNDVNTKIFIQKSVTIKLKHS